MRDQKLKTRQRAGAGAVNVAGDIYGNVDIKNGPKEVGPDEAALQRGYLQWVMAQCRPVPLSAFDALVGNPNGPKMQLEDVYTGLLTRLRTIQLGNPASQQGGLSALDFLEHAQYAVLLGKPGSGKSTFLNFVALCLAGELLADPQINLARLTAPLPKDDGEDEDECQPWSHAALIPVRIVLRDFAAGHHLPPPGSMPSADVLWQHIGDELARCDKADYLAHLRRRMLDGEAMLLLDGLDEVADADGLRERVLGAIRAFAASHGDARILVTARPYAYQRPEWQLDGFRAEQLGDFSDGQIRRFIHHWYARRGSDTADNTGRAHLLERAIFGRAHGRLLELARRPLLLTLMAHLDAQKGRKLPDKRVELYAEILDLLLRNWDAQRFKVDAQGRARLDQPALSEYLDVGPDQVRAVLERLAYLAHRDQGGMADTADIAESELVSALMAINLNNANIRPRQLIQYLEHRSGVLTQRGPGVYTFPHRSFQEYLAACHLRSSDLDFDDPALQPLGADALSDNPNLMAELGRHDPDRWREVVLLGAAQSEHLAWDVADALAPEPLPGDWQGDGAPIDDADAWGARLAGQILLEATEPAKANRSRAKVRDRIRDGQLAVMRRSNLPAPERAAAGDCLSVLGDPRFEPNRWSLPNEPLLGFISIPAGHFVMGSDDQNVNFLLKEQPMHDLTLRSYWIARWPVTVAQFRAFVTDSAYDRHDPVALQDPDSRPVRYIAWHDACCYARWLNKQLCALNGISAPPFVGALASGRLCVSLPSEPEWEQAARGTDGRVYPWGSEALTNRANFNMDVGDTSVVGCYAGGSSPDGCEDLSGNVWEWTRSLSGDYPYPESGRNRAVREDPTAITTRVLRGGAFDNSPELVRCAVRGGRGPGLRYADVGFRVVLSSFTLESVLFGL